MCVLTYASSHGEVSDLQIATYVQVMDFAQGAIPSYIFIPKLSPLLLETSSYVGCQRKKYFYETSTHLSCQRENISNYETSAHLGCQRENNYETSTHLGCQRENISNYETSAHLSCQREKKKLLIIRHLHTLCQKITLLFIRIITHLFTCKLSEGKYV